MISVIIPTYNSRATLKRCIGSVKKQTMTDWECIIVDDGSTDDTRAELDRLTDGDSRFTLVLCDNNQGLGAARNTGMMYAKGDMLFFLDSDDYIDSDTLEYFTRLAAENPDVGIIVTPKYFEFEKENMRGIQRLEPCGLYNSKSPMLFSSRSLDVGYAAGNMYIKHNIPCNVQFPRTRVHEDMMCNMRLLMAGTHVYIASKPIYHYIRHIGSLIDTPLSQDDINFIRKTLVKSAQEFNCSDAMFERFSRFLENALDGRNKIK